jgi:hypothetical protein
MPMNTQTTIEPTATLHRSALSRHDSQLIDSAKNLSESEICRLRQKELLTIEESQMLLMRMIDEEYQRP